MDTSTTVHLKQPTHQPIIMSSKPSSSHSSASSSSSPSLSSSASSAPSVVAAQSDSIATLTATPASKRNATAQHQLSSSSSSSSSSPLPQGINAVQVNSAREMFMMTTRSRANPRVIQGSKTRISPNPVAPPAAPPAPITTSASSASTNAATTTTTSASLPNMATSSPFTNPNVSIPAKFHQGRCNNPQCAHCGSVIIPAPASSLPVKDSPSISISNWEIFTTRKPILNAEEIDYYEEKLNLPLPEMIFGKNEVRIRNTKHQWEIVFNSIDALDTVLKIGCDPNKLLKVAHSNHWFNYRQKKSKNQSSKNDGAINPSNAHDQQLSSDMYDTDVPTDNIGEYVTKMIKPYDWTYTPSYKGTLCQTNTHKFAKSPQSTQIPIHKLKRPDPILFFDDVVLYEDELADNGIAILQAKIRVMEERLLLLCRFFLRIDNVIFKIKDVRVFVEFKENLIIRDIKEQEDTYQNVYNKVLRASAGDDPRFYLRDSNWVSKHLPTTFHEVEEIKLE